MTDLKLFRVTLFVVALLAVTGGWAQQSAPTPRDEALHFIRNETQFHLGYLPTEQSHPKHADCRRRCRRTQPQVCGCSSAWMTIFRLSRGARSRHRVRPPAFGDQRRAGQQPPGLLQRLRRNWSLGDPAGCRESAFLARGVRAATGAQGDLRRDGREHPCRDDRRRLCADPLGRELRGLHQLRLPPDGAGGRARGRCGRGHFGRRRDVIGDRHGVARCGRKGQGLLPFQ